MHPASQGPLFESFGKQKQKTVSASRIYREALLQLAEPESRNVFRPPGHWFDLPGHGVFLLRSYWAYQMLDVVSCFERLLKKTSIKVSLSNMVGSFLKRIRII